MEEFKLPENWYINVTDDNVDMLNKWYKNEFITLTNEYLVGMSKWDNSDVKKGYNPKGITKGKNYDFGIKITTEQFIKYVLKEEVMNKEIVGWKLKEDCKQYEQCAAHIVFDSSTHSKLETYSDRLYNVEDKSNGYYRLQKAGVLELWFEPVYFQKLKKGDWVTVIQDCDFKGRTIQLTKDSFKNVIDGYDVAIFGICWSFPDQVRPATPEEIKAIQTLKFGGYDVTFKKVTSGLRITCNGETGTFSQIETIFNKFKADTKDYTFGSQKVKLVYYDGEANEWTPETECDPDNITIGCTTGTWKEFVAIYEKAKSML